MNVTLTLDIDGARDLLAAALAGRRHAYIDLERLDRALLSARRQLDRQDPDSKAKETPCP